MARSGVARERAGRRCLVLLAVVSAAAVAIASPAQPARADRAAPPRNLLLVTADDLNADSASWMHGRGPSTPRLDTLAAHSHRFVQAHVTAPICQPSRESLLTGRVPHRTGGFGFDPIARDVPTLVELLRDRGYLTAGINKLSHMRPAAKFPWTLALRGSGRRPDLVRRQVARAVATARRTGRPFFINVNLTDPHRPFRRPRAGDLDASPGAPIAVPGILEDLPPIRRELEAYYASVRRLDQGLGAVLDVLEESGHAHDTIVAFLSDNGMSFPFAKATVYRNGTWSPVLLRYPGMPAPATHDHLVSSVDVMPTLLDLLGVPPVAGMDGRSWVPLLRGETQPNRDFVVTHVNTVHSGTSFAQRCVRTRSRSLIFQPWADGHTRFRVESMRGASFHALVRAAEDDASVAERLAQLVGGVPLALYDLERDPDERRNVLDEPAYRGDVRRLLGLLLDHMRRTADPELGALRLASRRWGIDPAAAP